MQDVQNLEILLKTWKSPKLENSLGNKPELPVGALPSELGTINKALGWWFLLSLQNLLDKPTEPELKRENALAMIQGKVLKHLQLLNVKKYEDSDLTDDMQFLTDTLEVNIQDVR